jgi:hypothetical protein
MCDQLNLKVIAKSLKKLERSSSFHEFLSKELHCEKRPLKKELSCLNYVIL